MIPKRPGLILFSHGSKRPSWSAPFEQMRDELASTQSFEVRLSFLEGLGPRLLDSTQELMGEKCNEIMVFPVFLTASTHLQEDVPEAVAQVQQELRTSDTTIHQVNDQPLSHAIWPNTIHRAETGCENKSETTVVLPYYGSDRYKKQWTELLGHAENALLEAGFREVLTSPVGHIVGASPEPTKQAIVKGLDVSKHVTVVPMLLSPGIFQHQIIPDAISMLSPAQQAKVSYTPDGILPDPHVISWIEESVKRFLT